MVRLLNKIKEFFDRKPWLLTVIIILMLMFMSFQLRAQTADMKFADGNEYLKKMFSDEHGRMYLLAIDPYYYLRLSENLYDHGYIGETLKLVNGKLVPYDTCQYAPPGHPDPWEPPIICLVELLIYYIWHSIDPTVTIMNSAFWFPPLLSMLLVIPTFFIIRRVTNNNIGALVGTIALIAAPILLSRTCGGFADTPIFEILPLLFIVWFIFEAIHNLKNTNLLNKNFKSFSSIFFIISLALIIIIGGLLNYLDGEIVVKLAVAFYTFGVLSTIAGLIYVAKKYLNNEKVEFEIFLALAIIITTLAPKMWSAWWYGFDIISAFLVIYLVSQYLINKNRVKIVETIEIKNLFGLVAGYIILTFISLTVVYGINLALSPITTPLNINKVLSTYTLPTGWPNVYTTVAELNKPNSWGEIFTNAIGSKYIAILGIFGVLLSMFSLRYEKFRIDIKYPLLLIIWLIVTLYAATKGIRFAMLATSPLAIGFGIFIGQMVNLLKRKDILLIYVIGIPSAIIGLLALVNYYQKIPLILVPTTYVPYMAAGFLITLALLLIYKAIDIYLNRENKKDLIIKILSVMICIAAILPPLATAVPFSAVPTFNNGWKECLDWIKYNTPNNSVITSWWDNGHIYAWATRKMVTFDGGSQNSPRAYWVGRAFATSNENLSVGILRMLATSGDEAYKKGGVLMNFTHNNVSLTVKILNEILPVPRSEAYKILVNKYHMPPKDAKILLNYTHPEHPNPDYLITYNRMTDIASVWSLFGFWNFSLPPNTPDSKREYGYFLKGTSAVKGGIIVANIPYGPYIYGALINTGNGQVFTYIAQNINGVPRIVGILPVHKIYLKTFTGVKVFLVNKTGQYSIFIRPDKGMAWLSTRNLEDSIYAKMHFLDCWGLKHIRLVKASIDPTDRGIQPGFRVYKVDYGKEYLN
ncbi:STT3 domain-containing protein [Methanocaldococcus sp.]